MSWNLLWSLCWKLIIRLLSVCICAIIFVKVARNLMHLWRTLRGLRLGPFCGTYELRQSLISRMMYHAAWRRSRQFSLLVGLYTSKYSDRTMYRCTVLPDQLTHVLLQNVSGSCATQPYVKTKLFFVIDLSTSAAGRSESAAQLSDTVVITCTIQLLIT